MSESNLRYWKERAEAAEAKIKVLELDHAKVCADKDAEIERLLVSRDGWRTGQFKQGERAEAAEARLEVVKQELQEARIRASRHLRAVLANPPGSQQEPK